MAKYAIVARMAAQYARKGVEPAQAWREAAARVFPRQRASREKGCPRCAFLGLAEDGLIVGVPAGRYTRSKDNKRYAIRAVKLLAEKPTLCNDPHDLWRRVMSDEGINKRPNGQMDVVVGLWTSGNINLRSDLA